MSERNIVGDPLAQARALDAIIHNGGPFPVMEAGCIGTLPKQEGLYMDLGALGLGEVTTHWFLGPGNVAERSFSPVGVLSGRVVVSGLVPESRTAAAYPYLYVVSSTLGNKRSPCLPAHTRLLREFSKALGFTNHRWGD